MKHTFLLTAGLLFAIIFSGCGGSDINQDYHMAQRYWAVEDYKNALYQMEMRTKEGEKQPCYGTDKEPIFMKLIDENNFKVVLDDTVLGIKHRSEYAQDMFDEFRKMVHAYDKMDAEDKYIYSQELVDVEKFGLALQVYYFKLGNDNIIKNADDPNDSETQYVLRSNEQTVIKNFNLYLDLINSESALSQEAIVKYAEGIDSYFRKLKEAFPKADFQIMITKAELMLKKAKSKEVIEALNNLIGKLKPVPASTDTTQVAPAV